MTHGDLPATSTPAPAPGDDADRGHGPSFRELLLPSIGVWAALLLNAVLFGLIALRLGPIAGPATAVVVFLVTGGLLLRSTPTLQVGPDLFLAGRARVPLHLLGTAEALDAEQMRLARGPHLDARAYLCIRGWIAPGVKVLLDDPADPTPYWLVSSRRPQQLAAALNASRPALPDPTGSVPGPAAEHVDGPGALDSHDGHGAGSLNGSPES